MANRDHAVILRLVLLHRLDGNDVAAMLDIDIEHLGETTLAGRLHQNVGKKQGEWLMADQFARAPHRVAQTERLLLAGEARRARARQVLVQHRELACLAARGEHLLELELAVEMVLDHALVAAGDEDEMLDAGRHRLVDHVLDQRTVNHRQHFFGHGLGRREEARAEPCHGEHCFTDTRSHAKPLVNVKSAGRRVGVAAQS